MKKRKVRPPVLDPYLDIIDTWLEEDLTKHKKQRHTQIRIYDRLVKECNYIGGKRTVTTCVSKKKKELAQPVDKYIDLQHPGGEALVDFGTAEVSHEQKVIQIKYLVMSFPYSNTAYIWLTPSENIERFLTGLQEFMQLAGGVPRKIWFDNLSAAVVKIENYHDRKTTERFTEFALHHGFQYEFCGVGKGHEKGNVENKVGCTRRNWMVPMPTLITWEDLNGQMRDKAEQYLQEMHYEKLGTFSRPYSFKEQAIDWVAELTVIHKKSKAMTYAWIYSQLPSRLQSYVSIADMNKQKSRIGWLIKWLSNDHSIDRIAQAIERTSAYQQDQEGIIYHALYQVSHPIASMEELEEYYTPMDVKGYDPDLEIYDQLSKGGVAI